MLTLIVKMRTYFSFIGFIVFAILAALPFPLVYRWIYEGDALVLETISVEESEHVKADEVRAYLKDYLGKPLYGVDLTQMTKKLMQHPWIASVALRKSPPHEIIIKLRERVPVGVTSGSPQMLVDAHGLRFQKLEGDSDLPLIEYSKKRPRQLAIAANVIDLYNHSLKRAGKIEKVQFDETDAVIIVFDNGVYADLGRDNTEEKLAKLDLVIGNLDKDFDRLKYIYLGNYPNPQQIAVKFN